MSTNTALKTHAPKRAFTEVRTDLNLLPEKFKKQIRNAAPFAIGNVDSTTNAPTITFSAEALEGEDTWVPRKFRWTKNLAGEPTVERLNFGATILMEPTAGNKRGAYAGMKTSKSSSTASPPAPGSAAAIKFAPAVEQNAPGTLQLPLEELSINWGFDAPTAGDQPNGASTSDMEDERENPMWWTSVAKAGEYNINQTVKVVFDSDDQADDYQIVVPAASKSLIDVTVEGAAPWLFQSKKPN